MPATKRLVLDLPEETVHVIDARVSSGAFADAASVVVAAVSEAFSFDAWEDTPEAKAWLLAGDEAERAMEDGRDPGTPAAQVFAELKAELRAMAEREAHTPTE